MTATWKPAGIALLLLGVLMGGCVSGVKRAEDAPRRPAHAVNATRMAGDVTISLSRSAQAQLADNLKFDGSRLLATVRQAMTAKGLLAPKPDATLPTIEIVITDINVRSNFSAVMFGFLAGADRVAGDVVTRSATGQEVERFTVSATYALGGIAGGQDETRMGWLYESFARELIREISGGEGG